jgi:hypothetical protein
MVHVLVCVDNVSRAKVVIFQYLGYRIAVETWIHDGSLSSLVVCYNVGEIVPSMFNLLEENKITLSLAC